MSALSRDSTRALAIGIAKSAENEDDILAGCSDDTLKRLSLLARKTARRFSIGRDWSGLDRDLEECGALLVEVDEKLHVYPFKDVKSCWKQLFSDVSIIKAVLMSADPPKDYELEPMDPASYHQALVDLQDDWLQNIVKTIDMAFIMTGLPGPGRADYVEEFLWQVEEEHEPFTVSSFDRPIPTRFTSVSNTWLHTVNRITTVSELSLTAFEHHLLHPRDAKVGPEPIVIQGAMTHWRALKTWNSPGYLLKSTFSGRRLVPIETGESYTAKGWGQRIIPFKEYLFSYILKDPLGSQSSGREDRTSQIGYLAQHPLLLQLPSLRRDVAIPDYCYVDPPGPLPPAQTGQYSTLETTKVSEPLINAWLGPRQAKSPLHYDPYHNLLCQVVGRKYVRLYSPLETGNVYPRYFEEGIDMRNTSRVDMEDVIRGRGSELNPFPKLRDAKFVDCILEPGDMLYIPLGWWHFVQSMGISFSVSFWWN
ncbi:MAG: hypothetical protein M1814_001766 [Vezdaea aestivalis]|nr:MAG: hypothetical protein M1814_001766 [Vezdaea aestivalis]